LEELNTCTHPNLMTFNHWNEQIRRHPGANAKTRLLRLSAARPGHRKQFSAADTRKRCVLTALACAILFFGARLADAVTYTVNSGGDVSSAGVMTLRRAIAMTFDGDAIQFSPSVTTVTLTEGEMLIAHAITITGPGANLLTIQRNSASPDFRIFRIFTGSPPSTVVISGLTIRGGVARITDNGSGYPILGNGGGFYVSRGNLTLTNCAILNNAAIGGSGGGIYNVGGLFGNQGDVKIINCLLSGNSSALGADANYDPNRSFGGYGGAISNGGDPSTLPGENGPPFGGFTITNSTLSGNSSRTAGAGIANYGKMDVVNATITDNSAGGAGGGIVENGSSSGKNTTLRNTIIALNKSSTTGKDFYGVLTSQGYNLIGNTGGITITGTTTGNQLNVDPLLGPLQDNGGPTPTHALLSGSPATDKGDSSGTFTDQRGFPRLVDAGTISNAPGGDGADIGAFEDQSVCGNVVTNNSDSGPGSLRDVIANVCVGGTITFASSVVSPINLTSGELVIPRNMTISGPGANLMTVQRSPSANGNFRIFHVNSSVGVNISGLTITKGNPSYPPGGANSSGGGIFSEGTGPLSVIRCVIKDNVANRTGISPGDGGGLYNYANTTVILIDSTVSGNTSTGDGGGVYMFQGTLTVQRSTISGNTAGGGGGGGILSGGTTSGATCNIISSTISANSANSFGGGLYSTYSSVNIKDSIIAGNTIRNSGGTGPDAYNSLTSQGFNLIGNSSGCTIASLRTTDQIGTSAAPIDPLLGPLQDNGGPTLTQALLSGSPAIDKGHSSASITDQRGFLRPVDLQNIANVNGGDGGDIGAFEVQASTPTPTPTPTATPTTLANISTRLRVETGDNALIGGFIVTGTQNKKVIIRGIGPSLGLADQLANPTLELYSGQTLLKANDDWMNSSPADKQAIIDSTIPPTNELESAIVATLPASPSGAGYTAVLRGVNNGTGIGVIQIYDLDRSVDSKLANISTRGFVARGDNILFAGTIVLGQAPQKVIIRALGPSVPAPGAMADPTLELRDGNGGLLDMNDNWVDSPNKQAIIDSTVPPTKDAESAIVYNLPANGANYTAIVRGAGGTTGIAVVEVYALN
jgi:hypothetical protein